MDAATVRRFWQSVGRSVAVRVAVGVIFMALAYWAHAFAPYPLPTPVAATVTYIVGGQTFTTPLAACYFYNHGGVVNRPDYDPISAPIIGAGPNYDCFSAASYDYGTVNATVVCPSGYTATGTVCNRNNSNNVCPGNSTGTSSCACNVGYHEGTGTGGTICDQNPPCVVGTESSASFAKQAYTTGSKCIGGCTVQTNVGVCNAASCSIFGKVSSTTACGPDTVLGAVAPTNTCEASKCPATINGITTCVACGSPGAPVTTTTSSSTTSTDGSGSTTVTTTTTGGPGGTVTSAVTTTTVAGGGAGPTTTSENAKPKTPGDNPQEEFCANNPEALQCKTLGTPSDSTLGTQAVGIAITPVSVGVAGACPADVQLPHGAVWTFAGTCMVANGIRPVVLALAWLGAGLMLIGSFRS